MFKIIEDPFTNLQWLITQKGIREEIYYGAIKLGYFYNSASVSKEALQTLFTRLITQQGPLKREARDVIRNLTLDEYLLMNQKLLECNIIYNKKTDTYVKRK